MRRSICSRNVPVSAIMFNSAEFVFARGTGRLVLESIFSFQRDVPR